MVFCLPIVATLAVADAITYLSFKISRDYGKPHVEAPAVNIEYKTITRDEDGVKTVYQVVKTPGPFHGKVQNVSKFINGKMRDVLHAIYNDKGQLLKTVKEDKDGNHLITTFGDNGKISAQQFERTKEADVLLRLGQQEESLLGAVAKAASLDEKNEKLRDLADFYFFTENDIEKAKTAVAQMDNGASFGIRVQLVFYDHSLMAAEKIKAYQALMENIQPKITETLWRV